MEVVNQIQDCLARLSAMAGSHKVYRCAEMIHRHICAPKKLLDLFEDPNIQLSDEHEALICILHVLMMEQDFVPSTTQNLWHKAHHYSISYTHPTTGDLNCELKYLPLENKSAIIFAVVGTREVAKEHIDPGLYVKDHTSKNPSRAYKNVVVLNQTFKDKVVKEMLIGAQEIANINPTFGFYILAMEMKLQIFLKMDIPTLVALSSTNKEFRELIDHPSTGVWQKILHRDFPKTRTLTEGDWKSLYKKELEAKREEDRLEKERIKKKLEDEDRFNRLRGYPRAFEDQRRHMPFSSSFGLPQRCFVIPQEQPRRGDFASVNFHRF